MIISIEGERYMAKRSSVKKKTQATAKRAKTSAAKRNRAATKPAKQTKAPRAESTLAEDLAAIRRRRFVTGAS
jgi:hypothetical protein